VERAFLSVPTSFLEFDPDTGHRPGKVDPALVRQFMASVPDIYRMQLNGAGPEDFLRLRDHPTSESERLLGATYSKLFSTSGQPLRADFINGQGLIVSAGQHRAWEAKRIGVPYLPMHVTVPDDEHLSRIREACESEVKRLTPDMMSVPDLDHQLDKRFYPDRQRSTLGDRQAGPEAMELIRERGWHNPEVDRDLWWRDRQPRHER